MSFSTIFIWVYGDFSVPLQKISIKFNAYEKDIIFACYVPRGHVQYVRSERSWYTYPICRDLWC